MRDFTVAEKDELFHVTVIVIEVLREALRPSSWKSRLARRDFFGAGSNSCSYLTRRKLPNERTFLKPSSQVFYSALFVN